MRIGFRIVNRDFKIQVAKISTSEALGHFERLGCRMSSDVQPGLVIESGGTDDKLVSFPRSNRVAQPGRLGPLRQRATVRKNLTERHQRLMEDDDESRHLNDFEWMGRKWDVRHSGRQAAGSRVVLA